MKRHKPSWRGRLRLRRGRGLGLQQPPVLELRCGITVMESNHLIQASSRIEGLKARQHLLSQSLAFQGGAV